MMFGIEQRLAHTAKRAGLLSGGLLLCTVGAGFLTVAGWITLYPLIGIVNTALVFSGLYLGVGLIMIGAGAHRTSSRSHNASSQAQSRATTTQPIIEAFIFGVQAGARADRARR